MEELGHFVNFYCGEGLALGLKSRWLVKAPVGFWSTRPLVEILLGVLSFLLGWLSVNNSNKQSNAKKPSLVTITHNAVANSRQQQQHTIHKQLQHTQEPQLPLRSIHLSWIGLVPINGLLAPTCVWKAKPHTRAGWRRGRRMTWYTRSLVSA